MGDEKANRGAFLIQEHYCRNNAAPIYAGLCAAIAGGLTRDSAVGARILDWPGEPTRDALPLRLIGGLHALVLAGADEGLARVFSGAVAAPEEMLAVVERALTRHCAALMPWLDGPPQTNEPGRSGALMLGLIEIARRHGPKIELLEIGSSAGLNLLIDRYRFDLGGTLIGPADSPVTIAPIWSGPAPPAVPLEILRVRGCDIAPLDAACQEVEARLAAYVWAETPERLTRVRSAIALLRERGVDLEQADAAGWVETRLAEPQEAGVTRVLMHSVVWQYLPDPTAERIRVAMLGAGERATPERPVAWVAMEPDRALARQMVRVRSWPGHGAWQVLATAHAHGTWIDNGTEHRDAAAIGMPESARVSV